MTFNCQKILALIVAGFSETDMMDNGGNLCIIPFLYRHKNTHRGYLLLDKPCQGKLLEMVSLIKQFE